MTNDQPRYRLDVDDRARAAEVVSRAGGQLDADQVATLPVGSDAADLVAGLGQPPGAGAGG